MRRIFLTSTMGQPFIRDDAAILGRRFDLDFFVGSGPVAAIRMFLKAARADCSICWFASVYSYALTLGARLFGKRSIIIVGGVDAAAIPELGYGIWLSRWKSRLVRRALRRADRILVVDRSLADSLRKLSGLPLENIALLPTGYDPDFWTLPATGAERRGVLCVATCDSTTRGQIKGIDLLLAAAAQLPEVPFTLIGVDPDFAEHFPFPRTPNVRLLPPVPREDLRDHYQTARLYCQPSRHEGLPNALCEGMLCGAIPVGTRIGGMPEAIGDCGVLVEPNDPAALVRGIVRALDLPSDLGKSARERIVRRFPKEGRERGLIAAIEGVEGEIGESDAEGADVG